MLLLAVVLLSCISSAVAALKVSKPHIVIVLADDLGWNDVSFHGSDQIPTPNIDSLAYNGIILNSHYTPALCTPSRSSFLTGKYPTTLGMQHLVILGPEPRGLPLDEKLMPEFFRNHGYATHAIGKWHLGFHKKEFTPTYRGFDSHFGYWNGYQDYFDHTTSDEACIPFRGLDMRKNMNVDYESVGKYSTDLFTDEAVKIIRHHNSTKGPLFLYLAHLAVHSGNPDKPYQAPDDEIAKFSHISDLRRRVYAAMVSRLDSSVGQVVSALRKSGMLENSIVLFLSDNGGVTFGQHSNSASNFPLRGLKESPWEGGIRCVAAVWSPFLNRTKRVSNQMMHISDWLPTLYSAAGFDVSELGDIEGHDMWMSLSHDLVSPRTEILHNIDSIENYTAFTYGPWKYIEGTAQNGEVDGWYGDSGKSASSKCSVENIIQSQVNVAISGWKTEIALNQLQRHVESQEVQENPSFLTPDDIRKLRKAATVKCSKSLNITQTKTFTKSNNFTNIQNQPPYLFHVKSDPCENFNLAEILPDTLTLVRNRLAALKKSVRPPSNIPCDIKADPANFDNVWSNWNDTPPQMTYSVFEIIVRILTAPVGLLFTYVFITVADLLESLVSLVTTIAVLTATITISHVGYQYLLKTNKKTI